MKKKIHNKESKGKNTKVKSQTTQSNKKNKELVVSSNKESKKKINLKKYFTKVNITYFILFLLDIILVIYSARKNIVNYVVISDQEVFVGKIRYLLLGRNYINLIIIGFFYIYTCLINRFFLQRKNTKKFLLWLFLILIILNLLLFFFFTKKVY